MERVHTWGNTHNIWDAVSIAPSLCWFSTSDSFLHFSLRRRNSPPTFFVILGVATAPSLVLLWLFCAIALRAIGAGTVHGASNGDALLLETGLLAIFFAPRQLLHLD